MKKKIYFIENLRELQKILYKTYSMEAKNFGNNIWVAIRIYMSNSSRIKAYI